MPKRVPLTTKPAFDYANFGNQRPPVNSLLKIIAKTDAQNTPMEQLIAAHARIDLAAHGYRTVKNLSSARGHLAAIIGQQQKSKGVRENLTTVAVTAALHMPMIDRWEAAILGRPNDKTDYPAILTASHQAMRFIEQEPAPQAVDLAESGLIECIPLLLGARKTYQWRPGWMGRLALWREDHGLGVVHKGFNPNWDVGVCFDNGRENHIDPMKIQIQRTKTLGILASQAAGIRLIAAAKIGFDNPQQIVLSCLNEFESVKGHPEITLLSPGQLDAVTDNLQTKFKEPLPDRD